MRLESQELNQLHGLQQRAAARSALRCLQELRRMLRHRAMALRVRGNAGPMQCLKNTLVQFSAQCAVDCSTFIGYAFELCSSTSQPHIQLCSNTSQQICL
ncbi:unnamed protein product [Effrenium voratum]|nr:unnamed protein product [Effrenium voratum]